MNANFNDRNRISLWMQDREQYVHQEKLSQIRRHGDIPKHGRPEKSRNNELIR